MATGGDFLTDRRVDPGVRIRTAAVLLFSQRGYAATSIRDIARTVGLTNAGMYHHVTAKELLLADIMRAGQVALNESTDRALAAVDRPEDALAALISCLTAIHGSNRMLTRVADGELRSLTRGSAAYTEIVALRDSHDDRWRRVLADGVEQGVFTVANQRLTRLALMAMCTGTSEWFRPDGPATVEQVCEAFVGIGLAAVDARRDGQPVPVERTAKFDFSLVPEYPWEPTRHGLLEYLT